MDNMENSPRSPIILATCLAILTGLIPLGVYAALLGSVPQLHAAQALEMLSATNRLALLVDVRSEQAYLERHIAGAVWLPLQDILDFDSANDLPENMQGKTLLLACDAGVQSAQAARHLKSIGVSALSMRGGMQDWGRAWPQFQGSPFSHFELQGGILVEPFRTMSSAEQVAAALALLWIKPTYMLLSAGVSFVLLRNNMKGLRLLGWSLLVFLIGEIFCAINYILLRDNSYFAEFMHSYSMALAFGLAAYALLEGLDARLIHFSQADKKCAMLPVCGPCVKYQAVRCGMRRIAQLACVMLIVLALIPLLSPFSYIAYNTHIGNFNHYYVRPLVHQWLETRYSPLVAIILTGLALVVMQFTPRTTIHWLARLLFCWGTGFLGFALFRVALGLIFAEALVWATFWEELTELLFVGTVIYLLWVFQHMLLPGIKPESLFKETVA